MNVTFPLNNEANAFVRVQVQQQQTNAEWETLASTTVAREAELNLEFIPSNTGALKLLIKGVDLNVRVGVVHFKRVDLFGTTVVSTICNTGDFENDYRFGFNGQEKVNEIAGIGNHNTALFWEYDTRLGRRWNLDPVPQISASDYGCFGNNPIIYNDVLGNVKKGVNTESASNAKTLMDESIQKDEGSEKMRNLFKVGKDGLTFNKIDDKAYDEAYNELKTVEAKALANGYKQMINQKETVYVIAQAKNDIINIDPSLTKELKKLGDFVTSYEGKTLSTMSPAGGSATISQNVGLVTTSMTGQTSYTGGAVFNSSGIQDNGYSPDRSATYAHEGVGHYLARRHATTVLGMTNSEDIRKFSNESSIQVYNIHLSLNNPGLYDNGQSHNRTPNPTSMEKAVYNSIPAYLKR